MAGNSAPLFTRVPKINWTGTITAANTAKDGTGTVATAFTADATNGSYISDLRFRSLGTNVLTVARVFINNGSTNTVAANNVLVAEITLSATTLTETGALANYILPLNIGLPPGYKINITLGTAVAAGYNVTGIGGDY